MEKGTHWELGRWAHHLLPYDGGLHIFNVYGYSSDKERAHELNREVCLEIFAAVAALAVWDLAILSEDGYALSPDQAARAELEAWSKLWQPGHTTFPAKVTSQSSWVTGDLRSVIRHCPLGKARGVD
eukprot:969142-Amphidinium_carterae.1